MCILGDGDLIVKAGSGARTVQQETRSINQSRLSRQHRSTPVLLDREWDQSTEVGLPLCLTPPGRRNRPVLLVADSMGAAFDQSDPIFMPVVRSAYTMDRLCDDVKQGLVDLRYDTMVIWIGSHTIHRAELSTLAQQCKDLVAEIKKRNYDILIAFSTLIPKPRENHLAAEPLARYNATLSSVVQQFDPLMDQVKLIPSHTVFLDENEDIVRPIIANYDDGFHLNLSGAARLRKFWLSQLNLANQSGGLF